MPATLTRPSTKLARLIEREVSRNPRVDRENGVIRGVRVLGRESRNGRVYSEAALNDACRLYEGVKVNIDHPDSRSAHLPRGVGSFFGRLKNVRRKNDAVFADLHFLKNHPLAAIVTEAAESMPEQLGLSHNAEGRTRRDGMGRVIVEALQHVNSVDVVTDPATNRGLFESTSYGDSYDELARRRGWTPRPGQADAAEPLDEYDRLAAQRGWSPNPQQPARSGGTYDELAKHRGW